MLSHKDINAHNDMEARMRACFKARFVAPPRPIGYDAAVRAANKGNPLALAYMQAYAKVWLTEARKVKCDDYDSVS